MYTHIHTPTTLTFIYITYMQGSVKAILHKVVNEGRAEFVQHWLHGITCLEKEMVKYQYSSK